MMGEQMRTMTARGAARIGAAAVLTAILVGATGATADSAASMYADWSLSGTTGTMTIPATGSASATFTTTSTAPSLQSGKSTYLSANTPFGNVFGSSEGMPYLLLHTAAGRTPSATTFTFRTAAPASGWGFTLGDIDADQVTITATDAAGAPVPAASLGYESSFNFCAVTPRPSSCGTGPFTDKPVWDEATATLAGNGADTQGASAWFRPAAAIKTLTFTFSRLSGLPAYQIWFAGLSAEVRGNVTVTPDDGPPPTTLRLLYADGSPVLNALGQPVTTTTGADGSYAFPDIATGDYIVAMETPRGFTATGPDQRSADAAQGDATGVNFTLHEDVPPPDARTATASTPEDTPVRIPLVPAGTSDGTRVTALTQPSSGSATLDQASGVATYVPPTGFAGTATFSYTLTDACGATSTGAVRVTVTAPQRIKPTAPTAPAAPALPEVPVTG